MAFRAFMILLINEKLAWDWASLLESITKVMNQIIKLFRKESHLFIEFLNETVSKQRFLQIVQVLQGNMSIAITSGIFKGENVEVTVRVLDILNDANDKR